MRDGTRASRLKRQNESTMTDISSICNSTSGYSLETPIASLQLAELKQMQFRTIYENQLADIDQKYHVSIMTVSREELDQIYDSLVSDEESDSEFEDDECPVTVRRTSLRSTNVHADSTTNIGAGTTRRRSKSVPTQFMKTPMMVMRNGVPITEKYTVTKPRRVEVAPPVTVKRCMKQYETVISTKGSPLHVLNTGVNIAQAVIPIKNGMVLNIEPKPIKKNMKYPVLDEETRRQIKLLRDNLDYIMKK